MNRKRLATISASTLLAMSGIFASGAQATPSTHGLPLSPAGQVPLSPMSQQNAVRAAKQYLDYAAFSYSGLVEQLEYDDYSTEDATYAVNSITVDWNEQAAKAAQQYLDYTSFSHSGLIEQLEYDGYTSAQAAYGAAAAGY